MRTFRLHLADGRAIEIEAEDPKEAIKKAGAMFKAGELSRIKKIKVRGEAR